eukprot:g28801.t1
MHTPLTLGLAPSPQDLPTPLDDTVIILPLSTAPSICYPPTTLTLRTPELLKTTFVIPDVKVDEAENLSEDKEPVSHTDDNSQERCPPGEAGSSQLMRTKSDAGALIVRRANLRSPSDKRRIRRHRFSINGHFYNHK